MSGAPEGIQARLREEALTGRLPLLPGEREYSTRGIMATGFTYAVAAWCFLIGGYAANKVGAVQGLVTLIAGCTIGVAMSAAASALACNRYGLEQIDYTKSCFGQRGAKIILLFYVVNQIGWTGMILVMFGKGVVNVAGAFGLGGGEWLVRGAVLAGLLLAYRIVVKGVHVLNVFNLIVTPGLVIVTLLLFYVIFRDGGWAKIAAAGALDPGEDRRLGYMIAFEYGLGAGFSWWPGIGFLARNTDNQRNSLYPQILTMGVAMGIVCCTGLLAALLFRSYDPTEWMLLAGGKGFGAAALLLVAVANLSASAIMMYTAALGLRHLQALKTMPWKRLAALAFLPVLAYVAVPSYLYEKGAAFLAYNATAFAPISGVLLVDWFVLRRRRLNLSQIFEDAPGSHYFFTGGLNWAALGCVGLGQVLYVWLYNPATEATIAPFRWLTASLPAVVVPMVVYAVLVRLWLARAGLGGYGAPADPLPLRQPNL